MSRISRSLLLIICTIYISGCKKNDPPAPDKVPDPIVREVKGIEIISGNNQLAYKGARLDTIILKVKLNASADGSPLAYYIKSSGNYDSFQILSQARSGGDMIIKAFWQSTSNSENPAIKLYLSSECSYSEMQFRTCKKMDSVVISAKSRQPWKSIYSASTGGYNVLQDIQFIDTYKGIVVGEGSGVIRTADGGKTWLRGEPVRNDDNAYIISFTGRDTALVNIVNNYAFFTYDGGKTFFQSKNWTPPTIGHRSSTSYYLQNRNTIYSVGLQGNIAKTMDGGQTWDKSGSFNILNRLNDLTHIGNDTLFTCGSVGFIARTINAGKTWKQQPVQVNNDLNKIYFINSSIGFIGGQNGALLRTTNGGEHWEKISSGADFPIIAIRFFEKGHGYLVSSGGEISESRDNGISWTKIMKSNYGAYDIQRAIIKDENTIFGLQQSSILTYDLSKP
ncbi:photosystem II stability/assembly factor-like uncharacterized protein [Pedobacter cryoconitis]|uniref:Photosystem II stability/assembly factor-like uncharacterized protein n=1 Tax=Pedobacter cryoconitis TaxID=188932 RepID=A0A7W8ZQE5_9SPHI|nr:hypothetical protein [Pedobacter cryoconitis]MBB5638294.1 photosystem II stability/assembly factor-like uncharacterized protein [Pedobacter cryoconitis]